jgi:hypothetical protein
MADAILKCCTRCGENKPIDAFPLCRGKPRARCKPCHVLDAVEHARRNPEATRRRQREWNHKNKPPRHMGPPLPQHIVAERRRQSRREWERKNPEAAVAAKAKWASENKHIQMEIVRRRQASKLRATPSWADRRAMQSFYMLARRLSASGVPHDVDHIVPLQHKLVCGLHCPANLQVIPRRQNRAKHNRYWPDMP